MRIEVKLAGLALALIAGAALAQTKPAPAKPLARNWNTTIALTPQGTHLLGNPAAKVKLPSSSATPARTAPISRRRPTPRCGWRSSPPARVRSKCAISFAIRSI